MATITQIDLMKAENLRCYYVDSDGDEVIVSDEEDYDVAKEYIQMKGEGKVKLSKCKRQHGDSEIRQGNQKVSEEELKNDLKQVEETVSDDEDVVEIQDVPVEVGSLSAEDEIVENKLNQILNSKLKETVSEDASIYLSTENNDFLLNKEVESDNLGDGVSSEIDTDSQQIPLSKRESENTVLSQSIVDEFDIVQSRIHSYAPHNQNKVNLDVDVIPERLEISKESTEEIKNEDSDKEEGSEQLVGESQENLPQEVDNEEGELHEMNDDKEPQLESEELITEVVINEEVVNEAPPQEKQEDIRENEVKDTEIVEENKFIEESKFQEIEEVFNEPLEEEFNDEPRLGVAVSVAQARVVGDDKSGRVNYLKRAFDNLSFIFNSPQKKIQIADIDECDDEKSQEYVMTAKPGQLVKKRWRLINRSNICWPKKTDLICETEGVDVELPVIKKPLRPGQKVDISVNIRISPEEKDNTVKVFVFRLYSKVYGHFGVALVATIEVIPEIQVNPIENMSQMDKLEELLEGDEEVNPIMYEIANDFVEEGLGDFDACLNALIQCRTNYDDAKKQLLAQKED
eukprot:CAMPEP_0205822630 /NCGR_PEP_ID=MMETSP0206-20130828/13332_1 /ASSEMBLY_ACC=CAM_ASM_000279 /TAXON_ID=36767 /ORGANISM="Euplotes focardii, Strain TN1" /LENGTH=571 /DNA_ID=CAMNT_0053119063 /DNA_START=13 /DNA_END=1728 /DNA_ORIENTATION=+